MRHPILEKIGASLVREVRDEVIDDLKKIEIGVMKGETAKRLRSLISEYPDCGPILDEMIPYVVDRTLYKLLWMLEQNQDIQLIGVDSSGQPTNVATVSDGLAGELFGEGWIKLYSKHPPSIVGR